MSNEPKLDVLSPAIGISKAIDPARWTIQFDLEVQEAIVNGWSKPEIEPGTSKKAKKAILEDDALALEAHKRRVADLKAKLAEYDKAPGKARISICLMDPVKFSDMMARRAILIGKPQGEIETMREQQELDRETIAWGVCGHDGVELMGKPISYQSSAAEFDCEQHTITSRRTVKEYERLGWRVSLPAAIIRFNQLTEEKKSG